MNRSFVNNQDGTDANSESASSVNEIVAQRRSRYKRIGMVGVRSAGAAGVAGAAFMMLTPGVAAAYDGNGAANYAQHWALGFNPQYLAFPSDDCTNFISQALTAGGGFPTTPPAPYQDLSAFYNYPSSVYAENPTLDMTTGRQASLTATVVADFKSYLNNNHLDIYEGSFSYNNGTASAPSDLPSSVVDGDVLFYDWGQGAGVSHATIKTSNGTDQYGFTGSEVSQHSNARLNEFWTLKPTNAYWATTSVYYYHLPSSD